MTGMEIPPQHKECNSFVAGVSTPHHWRWRSPQPATLQAAGQPFFRRSHLWDSSVFIKDRVFTQTTLFTEFLYGICWRHGVRCCVSVSLSEVWEDSERTCQPVALYCTVILYCRYMIHVRTIYIDRKSETDDR